MNIKNKTMTTEGLTKETEIRLAEFFNNDIDPQSMAKTIRQLNHIIGLAVMRESETLKLDMDKVQDSFYWLNKLAEVLNPYLDVE